MTAAPPHSADFGIIWDMDGTLVDTAEQHFQAWKTLTAELGRNFTRDDFTATFGRRNPEIIHYLFGDRFSPEETADIGERKEKLYRSAAQHGVTLLPGVYALLEGLRAAGFKQGVGSSAPRANLDLLTRISKTAEFFSVLVAMEDTQRGKPDPQVFQVAAQRLGVTPANAVVFEDAVAGVQAAKAGGMKCVAVTFVGHHPSDKLTAAGADLVVQTLESVSVDTVRTLLSGTT